MEAIVEDKEMTTIAPLLAQQEPKDSSKLAENNISEENQEE